MKIYKEKEKFQPVHIILTTQNEVDQLFSIANFGPIMAAFDNNMKGDTVVDELHEKLSPYRSKQYERFHSYLDSSLGYKL